MKHIFKILILLITLSSCKNNKELDILSDPEPLTELKSQEEHMRAAVTYLTASRIDDALKELTQCIRTYHNERAYIMKSDILLREKRYQEYLENTEDARRFEEFQSPTLFMHNGLGYELTGEEDKAKPFYEKALLRWTLNGTTQENYRQVLTQKPFLTAVVFGKDVALKDFDKIFSDFGKTRQDTIIREQFRPLLETYDGTGMSYFYFEIEKNPTE
tara:strand:+ start:500 stop:1147 length:648 start_codon:yes stop_codon:yes gene_type:complete